MEWFLTEQPGIECCIGRTKHTLCVEEVYVYSMIVRGGGEEETKVQLGEVAFC